MLLDPCSPSKHPHSRSSRHSILYHTCGSYKGSPLPGWFHQLRQSKPSQLPSELSSTDSAWTRRKVREGSRPRPSWDLRNTEGIWGDRRWCGVLYAQPQFYQTCRPREKHVRIQQSRREALQAALSGRYCKFRLHSFRASWPHLALHRPSCPEAAPLRQWNLRCIPALGKAGKTGRHWRRGIHVHILFLFHRNCWIFQRAS